MKTNKIVALFFRAIGLYGFSIGILLLSQTIIEKLDLMSTQVLNIHLILIGISWSTYIVSDFFLKLINNDENI